MSKVITCGWLASLLLLGLLVGSASAQKPVEPVDETLGNDVKDIVTAYQLADFGRKHKAPEAILAAATLFRQLAKVPLTKVTDKPDLETEGTGKPIDKEEPAPDLKQLSDDLFDEAEALGAQLKLNLTPLIKAAKERPNTRSPVGGAKFVSRMIGPRDTQTFHFKLIPNQPTQFGFRSTLPLRVTAVRADNDNTWAAGILSYGTFTFHVGGKRSGAVPLTLRFHNPNNAPVALQFFLR